MRSAVNLAFAAAAALLAPSVLAMNPEDVVGVISDTVVPDPDLCQSLCQKNKRCYFSLYHLECDQCFQMDCVSRNVYFGAIDWTKPSMDTRYYCDDEHLPESPTDCGNITATATVTSLDQAEATGGSEEDEEDSASMRQISWAAFGISAVVLISSTL